RVAAGRAVEEGVADQDWIAQVVLRRAPDDAAAAHALADVVVGLALESQLHAGRQEGAQALARRARQLRAHTSGRRLCAEAAADLAPEPASDRAVAVRDLVPDLDEARLLERRRRLLREPLTELSAPRPR